MLLNRSILTVLSTYIIHMAMRCFYRDLKAEIIIVLFRVTFQVRSDVLLETSELTERSNDNIKIVF